jgi:hypothetical protein
MTDNKHPITPPPELIQKWSEQFEAGRSLYAMFEDIYRAGADAELEACCAELESIPSPLGIPFGKMAGNALRAARRPKTPSLKEQALDELHISFDRGYLKEGAADTIRRALEQLDD